MTYISKRLSCEATIFILRLLVEIRELDQPGDRMPVAIEAGLAISQGVFGCYPCDLPGFQEEMDKGSAEHWPNESEMEQLGGCPV